jgi:hypothetical protein
LAGKGAEETNHNIGNTHSSFILHMHILHHDQKRKRWQPVTVDAVSAVDVVVEEDRTTLVPAQQQRVVSVLHLVTMCLLHLVTMCLTKGGQQLQIRYYEL